LRSLAPLGLRPAELHDVGDAITCPVLVVHGDDDHHVPVAFARASARRHPSWRLAVIPGAGHVSHRAAPASWLGPCDRGCAGSGWARDIRRPVRGRRLARGRRTVIV
jgi:pimeloyl-ACP methyl ester carboxylesterase